MGVFAIARDMCYLYYLSGSEAANLENFRAERKLETETFLCREQRRRQPNPKSLGAETAKNASHT